MLVTSCKTLDLILGNWTTLVAILSRKCVLRLDAAKWTGPCLTGLPIVAQIKNRKKEKIKKSKKGKKHYIHGVKDKKINPKWLTMDNLDLNLNAMVNCTLKLENSILNTRYLVASSGKEDKKIFFLFWRSQDTSFSFALWDKKSLQTFNVLNKLYNCQFSHSISKMYLHSFIVCVSLFKPLCQ